MFAAEEKRSDVVWIMSDIIFPVSYVVFPVSNVVFTVSGKIWPTLVLRKLQGRVAYALYATARNA